MIQYKTGNLLTEDAEALVNSVNCVGVMGRGIALQFKNTFPENFKAYAAACKREEVKPGRMFVFDTRQVAGISPRYIINFPTKRHWRGKSRMEDIEKGLTALVEEINRLSIRSIAIPPLGSGLGGLDWSKVRSLIEAALQDTKDLRVVVFEPERVPSDGRANHSIDVPEMTQSRAVLVGLMHRYLSGLLASFVTLLEVHKLMYFMQKAGEPLDLRFQKSYYGPYAENLRHVIKAIEGHLISGYADGGDMPYKRLRLVPGAIEDAQAFLNDCPESKQRFDRVSQLVDGFESSFGLELLATVHWIVNEYPSATEEEVITHIYAWNERKKCFSKRQIRLALEVLRTQGWFSPQKAANSEFTPPSSP